MFQLTRSGVSQLNWNKRKRDDDEEDGYTTPVYQIRASGVGAPLDLRNVDWGDDKEDTWIQMGVFIKKSVWLSFKLFYANIFS